MTALAIVFVFIAFLAFSWWILESSLFDDQDESVNGHIDSQWDDDEELP